MDTKFLLFYLNGIWRRKWIAAAVCWTLCAAGWIGVFSLSDVYQSEARVYVDVDSLLTPLLRGLAVESNPLQQLDYMQRTLLSRPNLEQVIHLADLDSRTKTAADKEDLLEELAKDVKVNLQGSNLFSISYEDNNAVEGKNIVQAVLTVFSESTAGTNRAEMDNARRFLEEQIANYEQQLRAAEARRARFQAQYGDVVSQEKESQKGLDQILDQDQKLKSALQEAQGRRDSIAKGLDGVPPTVTLDESPSVIVNNGPQPGDLDAEVAADQRKITDLLSRYTEDYPDVLVLKRDIASLKEQAKAQAAAAAAAKTEDANSNAGPLGSGGGGPLGSGGKSTVSNPVYEQLKLQLADADANIAAIQSQLKGVEDEKTHLQSVIEAAPGIQLKAEDLDRDYDVLKKNYDELVQRREAANLAQAADTQADKVQFRIVDAPQVPLDPVAPNRPLLYSGVLVAGLAGGIGAAFLLVQLDRSYASIAALRNLGLPVLGAISLVILGDSRKRVVREIGGLAAGAFALLIVYSALMVANFVSLRGVI